MRTTSDAVEALLKEVEDGEDLAPFILTANELVTEVCTDKGYSDVRMELIERWLSAHFFTIKQQKQTGGRAGPVAENFTFSVGLILLNTEYGQMALTLDTAGGLAALSKSIEQGSTGRPRAYWLGTEE